jgi:hypothetical protein
MVTFSRQEVDCVGDVTIDDAKKTKAKPDEKVVLICTP